MAKTIKTDNAFPMVYGGNTEGPQHGVDKREYFAAIAMQGILAADPAGTPALMGVTAEKYARYAVMCADSLIDALNLSE